MVVPSSHWLYVPKYATGGSHEPLKAAVFLVLMRLCSVCCTLQGLCRSSCKYGRLLQRHNESIGSQCLAGSAKLDCE